MVEFQWGQKRGMIMSFTLHLIFSCYVWLTCNSLHAGDTERKYHQLSKLHTSFVRLSSQKKKEEFASKCRFYLFKPIKTQKNDTRSSSVAAAAADWLDWFWRHQAVVREKETGFFLRMLHRIGHAEIKLQHHSHIHPARVSKTWNI